MTDDVFDAGWLALREPADHRARPEASAAPLARAGTERGWSRVLDLGGGTGSNLRWLAPRLPWARHWTVVDHDAALLARIAAPPGGTVEGVEGDLAREGLEAVARADLVTASALLDLVGEPWLQALADACARRGCPVLLALSYDGTARWSHPDPDDERVREAVNEHQRREKGMGAALGPDAPRVAARELEARGYQVRCFPSPWVLQGEADAPLARALLDGWLQAADELRSGAAAELAPWRDRRLAGLASGTLRLEVGHQDLLALPPDGA